MRFHRLLLAALSSVGAFQPGGHAIELRPEPIPDIFFRAGTSHPSGSAGYATPGGRAHRRWKVRRWRGGK